jgi:16S rRNA (adenine1518-N6/adenine1519-N6)-dimethyltransferase
VLARHGIHPSRALGQSFLLQPAIAERIAAAAELSESAIEIGPGLGILTRALAARFQRVAAIEVDRRLARILREEAELPAHVEVIEGDALGVDYAALAARLVPPCAIVANLPYAVSTPLLFRFLDNRAVLPRWVLMLQREVGERILAGPDTEAYGTLSVPFAIFADVKRLFTVGRANFYPRPEVESIVLRFDLRDSPRVPVADPALLSRVIREAFGRRRKTLANALASLVGETGPEAFVEAGIDPRRRGETLSPEEFARLSNAFARAGARAASEVSSGERRRG